MTIAIADSLLSLRLQVLLTAIESGASAGKLMCYHGTQPGKGVDPSASVLQASVIFSRPAATIVLGTLTFALPAEGLRIDSQSIDWCRITDGDGRFVLDGSASGTSGQGDFKLDSTTGLVGSYVRLKAGSSFME